MIEAKQVCVSILMRKTCKLRQMSKKRSLDLKVSGVSIKTLRCK